jgi:hypothetical protein
MSTWAEDLIQFYTTLKQPKRLPNGIEWLYPQQDPVVMDVVSRFCHQFFNDANPRHLLLGINPGRHGAGITGVNFTAARQLTEDCGITHPWQNQSELSAEFVYKMIRAYGGPALFYQHYFIGSVCPLGFIKEGKNINYYDDKDLLQTVEPFIIKSIEKQLQFHVIQDKCLVIGGEKNFKYLSTLNERYRFFKDMQPLPHPRFIMQYRRKQLDDYIQLYLNALPV